MAAASLPILITTALNSLSDLMASKEIIYGCPGHEGIAMRADKRGNIQKGLEVLIRSCSLQHDGVICRIFDAVARPLTVVEMAHFAGFSERTAARVIDYLVKMGWVESKQIRRKNPKTGQIEVSWGIRRFTQKFWAALGLWRLFKESLAWAKEHGKRRLIVPFKAISVKVKSTVKHVSSLVKSVLGDMSDDALRVKNNCDILLGMLRQRK